MPRKKKSEIFIPDSVTGNSKLDEGLKNLPNMTNSDALDVALALQQLIRGNESILSNQDKMSGELSRLRERMDKYDQAAIKFEENREKFIQEVLDRSESIKPSGEMKERVIAKGAQIMQNAIQEARASVVTENLKFVEELSRMRKVKVISPGRLEMVSEAGGIVPKIFAEEIRIKNKVWVLPPGKEVEVPEIVATALHERRRIEAENNARSQALQRNLQQDVLISEMKKIDKEYGINHYEGEVTI